MKTVYRIFSMAERLGDGGMSQERFHEVWFPRLDNNFPTAEAAYAFLLENSSKDPFSECLYPESEYMVLAVVLMDTGA